jgi:hypothetical protein
MAACECGCGGLTNGAQFLPGHDQKLRAQLEGAVGGLLPMRGLVSMMQRYVDGEMDAEQLATAVRRVFARVRSGKHEVARPQADAPPAPADEKAAPAPQPAPAAAPPAPSPPAAPPSSAARPPAAGPSAAAPPTAAPPAAPPAKPQSSVRRAAEGRQEERAEILRLFLKRNMRAGDYYPLPEFRRDFAIDSDPARTDVKLAAFRELAKEGLFVETGTVLQLTDKGFAALRALGES